MEPIDRTSLTSKRDPNIVEMVIVVGEELLTLCDMLIDETKIDRDVEPLHLAVTLCLVYFLGKIQRVTRAALTLILYGQGIEAMALIREQNDFVMAFNYYKKHPDQAQLFMASQVLLKRNFANELMEFDEAAARDPKRIAQLEMIQQEVADAYRQFPNLRRPKGKSGQSKTPVLIDWSEPSNYDIFFDVMDGLMRDHLSERGEPVDEAAYPGRLKKIVDRAYFFRNTFISQAKHGTAFDIGADVDVAEDGKIRLSNHQISEPNGLAFHFIQNAMPPLLVFRDHNVPGAFESELSALLDSYIKLRQSLGIVETPVTF